MAVESGEQMDIHDSSHRIQPSAPSSVISRPTC